MKRIRHLLCIAVVCLLSAFAIASYMIDGMQRLALWICVPSSAILAFLAFPEIKATAYLKLQVLLYLWIAFTALFAIDKAAASGQISRIIVCFLAIFSFSQIAKEYSMVKWLYVVYIILYFSMMYYARTHILDIEFDYSEERLGDEKLNANMIAYCTFFITFVIFIMDGLVSKKWLKVVFRWLFLLSPIWSFAAAILTSSRQVMIIQAPLIGLLFYVRYIKNRSRSTRLLFIIISIFLASLLAAKFSSIYEGSYLSERNQESYMEDSRITMIKDALSVGFSHPLVGVGPGCFGIFKYGRSFSHCNYVELFANSGFFAMLLCIIMYGRFIIIQWKRYNQYKDSGFLVFLIFGIMYAVDNVFYVFYSSPWLIAFFFLVIAHSEHYYSQYMLKQSTQSLV